MQYCVVPHCSALVATGRCAQHARQQEQGRGTARQRGYDSVHWRPARDAFLAEFPLCGMRPHGRAPVYSACTDEGRAEPATVVDHIVPHHGNVTLFWDRDNWQALCASCHARKTRAGL